MPAASNDDDVMDTVFMALRHVASVCHDVVNDVGAERAPFKISPLRIKRIYSHGHHCLVTDESSIFFGTNNRSEVEISR